MVFFLMAFVGYFVITIIALVLDFQAMDAACASESWVWLYVLLAIVIPTSLGFVMGLVKTGLNLADLKGNFGWEIPAVFLSLPGPILYIVLAVLGWILWLAMEPGCNKYYESTVATLYAIFHIQVSFMYRIGWYMPCTAFLLTYERRQSIEPTHSMLCRQDAWHGPQDT
jgi:hypothetical protein